MVRFEETVVERTKRKMQYIQEHEKELEPRTLTVLVRKADNFQASASRPGTDFVWVSDEPRERGGQDRGTNPLSYFLSGLAFCQMVHYAEHSMVEGVRLESLEMKIEGKVVLQRPRRFTDVSYEVRIQSPEDVEKIRWLARTAAEDCYVTNTLKEACRVSGLVYHNGTKIDEHH